MADTKQKILDAAERLLAEQGFEGASLRAITAAAQVNLAAVNYHFHTKEALMQAVITRRVAPVNRERLAQLDACEHQAGDRPAAIEPILRALIAPMVGAFARSRGDTRVFGRIIGGIYFDRQGEIQLLIAAQMTEVIARFIKALQRALPGASEAEISWRLFFAVGSVIHFISAGSVLRGLSRGLCDPSDIDGAIDRLVSFAAAGLTSLESALATIPSKHRQVERRSSRTGKS